VSKDISRTIGGSPMAAEESLPSAHPFLPGERRAGRDLASSA